MAAPSLQRARKLIGKRVTLVFDCPLGSRNSHQGYTYETNYGFVKGSEAEGRLNAYYIGTDKTLREAEGQCIAVIYCDENENENVKLVIAPPGATFSDREIASLVNYQEQWFDSKVFHK